MKIIKEMDMKPELQSVIAGITLLPASEQQEFFDAVRAVQYQQVVAGLESLVAGVAAAPIDKRVKKFVSLRDARAASNKEADNLDKQFKMAMDAIERSLIAEAQATGVTGFKTEYGTTYLDERMVASIADDAVFFDFVRCTGDLDFFERRVKVAHIREYVEQNGGAIPPGLNTFREVVMKVRRS